MRPELSVADELGRAFLQKRLSVFARIGAVFLASALVWFNAVNLLNPAYHWTYWILGNRSNLSHGAAALLMAVVWAATARGPLTRRQLRVLDLGGTYAACLCFVFPVIGAELDGTRKEAMLLEVTHALVLRAIVVPSRPLMTCLLALAVVPPAVSVTAGFEAAKHGPEAWAATRHTAEAALFALIATAVSALASDVIYGLRVKHAAALRCGQYTLEARLGEGAMGVVYLARHALLRRPTAVKLLPAERTSEAAVKRFEREVQSTSQLTHPNTVAIYDYGRTPDGTFYYAMEHIDGPNLHELVRLDGPQDEGRVVHVLRQVCAALAEAHRAGLVHRDIKPANIMLCRRGGHPDVVKVVDFGLVRETSADGDASGVLVVGTPGYMSPEAIRSPSDVGPASDLYGVGAVGYYLLCGKRVFDGPLAEVLADHLRTAPTPPSARRGRRVAPDLEGVILQCLEKDPDRRPHSAEALDAALAACAAGGTWTRERAEAWWRAFGHRPSGGTVTVGGGATRLPVDASERSTQATLAGAPRMDVAGRG